MEMEYSDPGRRGRFIVVVGLILAVVAGTAAFFLIQQAQQQAGQGGLERQTIVVAARDIPARKQLEAADVTVREVPVDPTNAQGVYVDPVKVVGLITSVPILNGQPIYANLLAGQTVGTEFSILAPNETVGPDSPAWRAVAITVPDDRAAGGLIVAGQTVDVVATTQISIPAALVESGKYYADKSTKVIYQDMVILAKTATSYVVKATLPVAEEISHLEASGSATFSLLLRPDQDLRQIDATTLGTTTDRIIARYGFPLPEVYPPGNGPLPSLVPSPSPSPSPSPGVSPAPSGVSGPDSGPSPSP